MWLGSPRDGSAASTASYSYSAPQASRPPSCAGRSSLLAATKRVNGQLANFLSPLSYWGLIRECGCVRMQVLAPASSLRRTLLAFNQNEMKLEIALFHYETVLRPALDPLLLLQQRPALRPPPLLPRSHRRSTSRVPPGHCGSAAPTAARTPVVVTRRTSTCHKTLGA